MSKRSTTRSAATGLTLLTASALALTGCASSPDEGASQNSFSFTYQTSTSGENPYETLANAYMKVNPDVKIELNAVPNDSYDSVLRTQLQAGNAADLVQTTPGTGQQRSVITLAEAGLLAPLGGSAEEVVPAGSEALFQLDDETYGLALDISVNGLIINTTAAADAGLEPFPTDYDDFVDACDVVTAAGKSPLILAGSATTNVGVMATVISATRVYADNPTWNAQRAEGDVTFADSEGWHETLQTIVDLNEQGCFQAGAAGADVSAITNGMVGGTSVGAFAPGGAATDWKNVAGDAADFSIVPFPVQNGGKPFILAGSFYSLSIPADAKNKEAAQAFLDWIASPEGAQTYTEVSGALPASGVDGVDLTGTPYATSSELLQAGDFVPNPQNVWPSARVMEALSVGTQGLLTGQTTVEGVLESMDAAWQD